MKNRTFLINVIVITGTALLLRSIGIYLNAYLSRQIGAEGVGLYNLIYSVYIMAAALVTSGIGLAVSRIVAEQMEKKNSDKIASTMLKCTILSVALSLLISALLFWGADVIAVFLLGDARTAPSLRIMAPSFSFMAVSACLRGYFIAARKAYKSAASSLFEQMFRITLTVTILRYFISGGLESACMAVVLGSTSAEVLACFFSFLLYFYERRKYKSSTRIIAKTVSGGATMLTILGISLPMTLSTGLRTGLRTAESMLIPAGLRKSGVSHEASLAEFGIVSGMVMPVLFFPASFLMSAAMLILPEIARAWACGQKKRVSYMASRVFQFTLYMSIIIAGMFVIFSDELCMALYKSREAGRMVRLLAPLVPLIYLDHMVDGMLNGLNQQMMTLKLNTVDSALRIGLILTLVPLLGVNGYIITLYISTLFNSSLSMRRLLKVSGLRIRFIDWVLKPVFSALLSALIASILFNYFSPASAQVGALIIPEIAIACIVYLGILKILGVISNEDIIWFKSFFKSHQSENVQYPEI